jgi:exodeoxyribonuclease VIII
MLWEQYGLPCKARVDYLVGDVIFDLKTCQDASPEGFARQIGAFQYHLQAAHYAAGYEAINGKPLDRFCFIAVESEPPYATGVYVIDSVGLQSGRAFMAKAAKAFKQAQQPEKVKAMYADHLVELTLPNWSLAQPFSG